MSEGNKQPIRESIWQWQFLEAGTRELGDDVTSLLK